jgi:hypothetical protein
MVRTRGTIKEHFLRRRKTLMRRLAILLTVALLVIVLLASGVGTVSAEPHKNQIVIEDATCTTDDGQSSTYTFVINGMGKVGQIVGSNGNIVVKSFTVTYFDPDGNLIGGGTFGQGNKKGLQENLIVCDGSTTTELQGLGVVTAVFEFHGFFTPRGG